MSAQKITCKDCGYEFKNVPQPIVGEEIPPCPKCGSTKLAVYVSIEETMKISDNLEINVFSSSSTALLMQAVVESESKTDEGIIISAVSLPWLQIVETIKKDPSFAYQISPEKWEEIIAGAYKKSGFDEVILTPRSGDLGRDVIATKKGIGIIRIIDQVKAYKPGHLVTANDVRALMGVLQGDQASKGFLTTTSDFAPKLKSDPLIQPFIPSRIELINGNALQKRLEELSNIKS